MDTVNEYRFIKRHIHNDIHERIRHEADFDGHYARGNTPAEARENLPDCDRFHHWSLDRRRVPWKTVPAWTVITPTEG